LAEISASECRLDFMDDSLPISAGLFRGGPARRHAVKNTGRLLITTNA
jgi:hypothetical protein